MFSFVIYIKGPLAARTQCTNLNRCKTGLQASKWQRQRFPFSSIPTSDGEWQNQGRLPDEDLEAGEYTIEATTYDPEKSGDFTLIVDIEGEVSQPPPMPEPEPDVEYTAISNGANLVCALAADGSVMCWGNDDEGQVSDRPRSGRFTQISSGDDHTCALRDDGAVICWGSLTLP